MENIYFKMKHSGILGIIAGVCAMIIGLLVLISGIVLLKNKSDIIFQLENRVLIRQILSASTS